MYILYCSLCDIVNFNVLHTNLWPIFYGSTRNLHYNFYFLSLGIRMPHHFLSKDIMKVCGRKNFILESVWMYRFSRSLHEYHKYKRKREMFKIWYFCSRSDTTSSFPLYDSLPSWIRTAIMLLYPHKSRNSQVTAVNYAAFQVLATSLLGIFFFSSNSVSLL